MDDIINLSFYGKYILMLIAIGIIVWAIISLIIKKGNNDYNIKISFYRELTELDDIEKHILLLYRSNKKPNIGNLISTVALFMALISFTMNRTGNQPEKEKIGLFVIFSYALVSIVLLVDFFYSHNEALIKYLEMKREKLLISNKEKH